MKSVWKFWCDAKRDVGATKLLHRVQSRLQVEVSDESIEPYHKGGHVVCFTVNHATADWKEFIFEVIQFGQRVGYSWTLSGDVQAQLDGWSNRVAVSGIQSMQWMCH